MPVWGQMITVHYPDDHPKESQLGLVRNDSEVDSKNDFIGALSGGFPPF